MTYRTEFPDFTPDTMPQIPATWRDQSWHNDACPCFNTGTGKVVFIDYAEPAAREFPDTHRFSVHVDPEIETEPTILLSTDDWPEVCAFVEAVQH